MNIFNKILVGTLLLVPKPVVRKFANRYIAGDKLEDAVEVSKKLNDKGIMGTIDVLGEDVFSEDDASRAKLSCLSVLEAIDKHKLNANQSVKLTSLGLKIDLDFCLNNLTEILTAAKSYNIFVRIDMEDSSCTDDTIKLFEQSHEKFNNCGIVLQSYLRRSFADTEKLIKIGANFRLCKGIYIEPEEIAFKDKQEIRNSFLRILKLMLENNAYVGIATHDDYLIDGSYRLISELKKSSDQYEFQMLLGVRESLRDKILKDGHRMRVYIPFGTHWYQYSIRRFKENPQMAGYVMKSIFTGGK
ncbi:MAG: proline dehydrogenase family protein [Chlorobi bacterium]|nr:proline dehydrogenase family protein [Chlorobiota bacterium]MCI0714770.1 proline dehydrogenase family protein [Chlorobiota bacterium]